MLDLFGADTAPTKRTNDKPLSLVSWPDFLGELATVRGALKASASTKVSW
jgi:hypothetical protein